MPLIIYTKATNLLQFGDLPLVIPRLNTFCQIWKFPEHAIDKGALQEK